MGTDGTSHWLEPSVHRVSSQARPVKHSFVVYSFYSTTAELLYVGATNNFRARKASHATDKSWWSEVDHNLTVLDVFTSVDDAADRELELIRVLKPKYNRAGITRGSSRYQVPDHFKALANYHKASLIETVDSVERLSIELDVALNRRNKAVMTALSGGVEMSEAVRITKLPREALAEICDRA